MSGTEIIGRLASLSLEEREEIVLEEVLRGNVPEFLRRLVPVTIRQDGHTATFFATPDYLAIGSDEDYFLVPLTPGVAQRIADRLDCTLPTRKMVDRIWSQAPVKLEPSPIPPGPAMTTVPVFAEHNAAVRKQRDAVIDDFPLGTLVAGTKKDVILSRRIFGNFANPAVTRPVVIYGWHHTDGTPIQPVYNGHHETYVDYSHGIRLVQNTMLVDGDETTVRDVLRSPALSGLLSDEGVILRARYR